MAGKVTVQSVYDIVKPFADEQGLDIWDVCFVKEGADWYLRIFVDKDGGVSIDDCVNLTHAISKPLDEADPIKQSYYLEVSSPGIERELTKNEHFKKFIGSKVLVRTIRPINNVRDFNGVLESFEDGKMIIRLKNDETLELTKKDTSFVKLDDFDTEDFNKEI